MSSLAKEFHDAWLAAKAGNLFALATLAPTSIVFGAWDSRSSQAKLQRLIKAHVRATNVLERTRSAQYTPAADYVSSGALDESISVGEDDKNNLSQEGLKHALSTQTVGGVILTAKSKLTRTVNVNLAAIRQLRAAGERIPVAENATNEEKAEAIKGEKQSEAVRTRALREYVLGLTLVAAYTHPNLNLREGCNLQTVAYAKCTLVQDRRKSAGEFDPSKIELFAEDVAKAFFLAAKINFVEKDKHGHFESGIAEKFLSMSTADRDKVRALGPITAETLKKFAEQGKDPFKSLADAIKAVKEAIGKPPAKKAPPATNLDAFKELADLLSAISTNASIDDDARSLATKLAEKARDHDNSHAAVKEIESELREFKKSKKAGLAHEKPEAKNEAAL
jgi:hypothetical protein